MLINGRNLLLGVPKCGSQTAGLVLQGNIVVRRNPHPFYHEIEGEFDNVYAFWRNPVDRFKSAVQFAIERAEYNQQSSDWRPNSTDLRIEDIDSNDPRRIITHLLEHGITPRITSITYMKQCEWYKNVPNLTLLPFAKYAESIEYLQRIFGVSFGGVVPQVHKTFNKLELEPDVVEMVMKYYEEDYEYEVLSLPR